MPETDKICFDRILPKDLRVPLPGTMFALASGPARAAFLVAKLWPNGSTIRIRFVNGTGQQQAFVQQHAVQWTQFANVQFDFNGGVDAPIRIAFDNVGSWSYIGTDAQSIPLNQPTMNFGWLDPGVVHHEFGHLMGMIHEHQNPINNPIQWNKPAVIAALSGHPNNWDATTIQHNMFDKYDTTQINGSTFDPLSVMLYSFPASWTLNGFHTDYNSAIAPLDQQFAEFCYPRNTRTIRSAAFPNVHLRIDGRGVNQPMVADGGGKVNCQFGASGWERFVIEPQGSGIYTIRSAAFPNVYLRMDGRGVTQPMVADGGGKVNCQFGASDWERYRIVPQSDGTVAIESLAFPNVYLRMDGRGVTQPMVPDGGGKVNCQFGASEWERFHLG